jgi:serine/threonine protein kinase/tetratricopeptide (TPR) repeat protein
VKSKRWQTVKELFEAALERSADQRTAFLKETCAGNESLRVEVEELIASYEQDKSFMERPALAAAAHSLIGDQTASLVGKSIGSYNIVREIGRGGMGEVYLAEDTRLGRQVALKLLLAVFNTDQDRLNRFKQEARVASALNHPNILTIHEIGRLNNRQFIATEFIEGETLRKLMETTELSLSAAVDVASQVADALAAAHHAGIVHRDIKPENIMVRRDGYVKVLDFGLAKLAERPTEGQGSGSTAATSGLVQTGIGTVMGTVIYMSPEQARGLEVDGRSDIWSLGVVLYEIIAGKAPFEGATSSDVMVSILEREPTPLTQIFPEIPAELPRIITKALRKHKEERYQSAKELATDLRRLKDTPLPAIVRSRSSSVDTRRSIVRSTSPKSGNLLSRAVGVLATLTGTIRRPRALIYALIAAVAATAMIAMLVRTVSNWGGAGSHRPPPEAVSWYDRGTAEMRDGSYFQASKAFERAIQIDDRYALAHARLGEVWSELDYSDKAHHELLLAQALVTDRAALPLTDAYYLQGVIDTITRNHAGAVESYRKLSEKVPYKDKKYAYVDLGRAYEKNEETINAINSYEQAARLDSEYPTPFLRLAILHGRQRSLSKADEAFKTAETLYQALSNSEGLAEVFYQRGLYMDSLERFAEARSQLEKAIETARADQNIYQQVRALLQRTSVLAAEGDTALAEQQARDAIEVARVNGFEDQTTKGLIDLGTAFLLRGGYSEAEKYFSQALDKATRFVQRANEATALLSLGSLRIQQQNPDEASKYVERALAFFQPAGYGKETANCNVLLGRAYRQKGDFEAALRAFKQQLQFAQEVGDASEVARAHSEIGRVLFSQEQYSAALNSFDESLEINKQLSGSRIGGYGLTHRAEALWRLGRYGEAHTALSEASPKSSRPGDRQLDASIHLIRAEMSLSQLDFQKTTLEARKSLEIADALFPEIAVSARSTLGLARIRSGSIREGRLMCEQAAEQAKQLGDSPLTSATLLAVAEALVASGDADKGLANAAHAQERVARLGQQDSEWRASLIAARASLRAGNSAGAMQFASNAYLKLATLEQRWGTQAYTSYLTRPDVRQLREQISQVLASSK